MDCWLTLRMSADFYSGGHCNINLCGEQGYDCCRTKGTWHGQAAVLSQGPALAPTAALSSPRPQVDL